MKNWLRCLKTTCVLALPPLMLSGCAEIATGLVTDIPRIIQYDSAYKAYYAKSDRAVIRADSSWSQGQETFFLVDGQPVDAAGFAYSWFSFEGIFVSPGSHRIVLKTGDGRFSLVEITATAHHTYRITTTKDGHPKLIRVWDETESKDRRTLQQEIRDPPEAENFFDALRTFKVTPDYAVVIGDTPSLPAIRGIRNGAGWKIAKSVKEDVIFKSIDGCDSETATFGGPIEMLQMRFVCPGTHQIALSVQGLGFLPGLQMHALPPIEAAFSALHIYRITANRTAGVQVLQIWDETEGTDKRTLAKEFRFDGHGVTANPS